MVSEYINIIFIVIYIFIISYALVSDFNNLIIPNWCSIALFSGFLLYSLLFLTMRDFAWHLLASVIAFALGIGFYAFKWFGAGDVKLLAAVMLWGGPANALVFVIWMALFGWILAFGLIGLKFYLNTTPGAFSNSILLRRPMKWLEEGVCPYGIAIGIAAMIIAPAIFTP